MRLDIIYIRYKDTKIRYQYYLYNFDLKYSTNTGCKIQYINKIIVKLL